MDDRAPGRSRTPVAAVRDSSLGLAKALNGLRNSLPREPLRAGANAASMLVLGTAVEPGMALRDSVSVPNPAAMAGWSVRARLELLLEVLAMSGRHTTDAAAGSPVTDAPMTLSTEDIPAPRSIRVLRSEIDLRMTQATPEQWWLAYAVVSGTLPTVTSVSECCRRAQLRGPWAALRLPRRMAAMVGPGRQVDVVVGRVIVDVHHTAHTDLATGIQRVARATTRRWVAEHGADVVLTGWDDDYRTLRRLSAAEQATALYADQPPDAVPQQPAVVPWRGTYVIPELAVEPPRTARMQALAYHNLAETAVIGFDCVPVSSGETVGTGMGPAFARNLAAVRHMDRVATISGGAAREYRGWARMLAGAGLRGPRIEPVLLPATAEQATDAALQQVREQYLIGSLPMMLVVGSHEPRKNHLAVLAAAEQLWHEGLDFSVLFVGGNSWNSDRFTDRVQQLRVAERPVATVSGMPDEQLWAAYRLAHVSVFPSLNEGYGLPVAESLACGTPAITSQFGSMAEIAAGGGALLVDPRNDESIATAMRRTLTEPELLARLRAECAARPQGSWDDYARTTWGFLVGGIRPQEQAGPDGAA